MFLVNDQSMHDDENIECEEVCEGWKMKSSLRECDDGARHFWELNYFIEIWYIAMYCKYDHILL